MAKPLDPKEIITLEELAISGMWETTAGFRGLTFLTTEAHTFFGNKWFGKRPNHLIG